VIESASTVEIAKPAAPVFDLVGDFSRAPEWMEGCVSLSRTSAGDLAPGASLHYVHNQGGRKGEMSGRLTTFEKDRCLVMEFADPSFAVTVRFDFEAAASGTKVAHAITIEPKGTMARMMEPMIRGASRRQVESNLSRLKKLLEG